MGKTSERKFAMKDLVARTIKQPKVKEAIRFAARSFQREDLGPIADFELYRQLNAFAKEVVQLMLTTPGLCERLHATSSLYRWPVMMELLPDAMPFVQETAEQLKVAFSHLPKIQEGMSIASCLDRIAHFTVEAALDLQSGKKLH
jgi:hypothetical protein